MCSSQPIETRYGDMPNGSRNTIHGTTALDVETDSKGKVVGVWFRCMILPFNQVKVNKKRASDMKVASTHANSYVKLKAVVVDNVMLKSPSSNGECTGCDTC